MPPHAAEVLVVGGGPAGAAAAIRLAREGIDTVLIDRARFPRPKPCAEYLSPGTLRQLDLLGALERVERLDGHQLAGTEVIGPFGARLTGLFAQAGRAPCHRTGVAVRREELDHTLIELARDAGVRVIEGCTVTELLVDAGAVAGAVARGRDGRLSAHAARLTIGADGLRSRVARLTGGRRHAAPARLAFVCHVRGVPGLTDRAEMHVGVRGYVGLNPMGGGVTNAALVVPLRDARETAGDPARFFFETLDRFPGVRGRVDPGQVAGRVAVTGPFASRARRVVVDGALLVGDAADFFDPFTGEGIGAALRGAALAVDAVRPALAAPGPVRARQLAAYVRARRRAFAGKWAVERLIGWGMLAPRMFDRALDRLERRGRGHTLLGVTGAFVPPREVLNPRFLAGMLW